MSKCLFLGELETIYSISLAIILQVDNTVVLHNHSTLVRKPNGRGDTDKLRFGRLPAIYGRGVRCEHSYVHAASKGAVQHLAQARRSNGHSAGTIRVFPGTVWGNTSAERGVGRTVFCKLLHQQ